RETRRTHRIGFGSRPSGERRARPGTERIVPHALVRGVPQPIHAEGAELAAVGVVDRGEANVGVIAVAEAAERLTKILQIVYRRGVDRPDHGAARYSGGAEYVSR